MRNNGIDESMTVADLIKKLQAVDSSLQVEIQTDRSKKGLYAFDAIQVLEQNGNKVFRIECDC
jgi:hypothetical protein